jgi:hypothetical protein
VTVTVTPSTPDLTTTPASLTFTSTNFNINQPVFVSAGLGAVPGAKSVLLNAGPLGQFNLPVTITPIPKTTFFINPMSGNDAFPGTAAQPWKTVEKALDFTQFSGSTVATAASAGNNVVVTILAGGTETVPAASNDINTPALLAGSVTVLQASSPNTFTLDLAPNSKKLTLNKGYKLQNININSNVAPAVEITHPTAGLASVDVNCTGTGICVKVAGAGSHILKDVRVDVKDNAGSFGIKSDDADANLIIVGGRVRPTGNNNPITLIDSKGILTATGLTVDMRNASHTQNSTGIVLKAAGSSVTGSTIFVSNTAGAVGIDVQGTASPSTVLGNTFDANLNGIGIKGGNNVSSGAPSALLNNNFLGTFTAKVLP